MDEDGQSDIDLIRALIARQFASLCWAPGKPAAWAAFSADFVDGARLYPAARPLKPQSVEGFLARMQDLAGTTLPRFDETVLGTDIRVFGNIAVALAACEITENATAVNRGVEALLLVRTEAGWRIAAQAWDVERPGTPIPASLAAR